MVRFTSLKSSAMVRFTSLKTGVLTAVKCECLPDSRSTLPFQLRWRRLAAAEAGAAASGAAGMPVRWPRRPAAVSEAVAAGAGPDFSCAGELEQPLKALIGEVRSLSVVCVCVSGLVGKVCGRAVDLPPWSVSSRVVCACWGSGFHWDSKQDFLFLGASSLGPL